MCILFLKTRESLGLIHCTAGRTKTNMKQPPWHGNDKESRRAGTCCTSLGTLTFPPLSGGDTSPARRLWLLVLEVTAKGEMQHFLVSDL